MLLLLSLLLASPDDLADKLRHLNSAAAAWSPSPAPDASRVAFITTMFGTRQAAWMQGDGGYPRQLTDEPGGVLAVRYVPSDLGLVMALAERDGRRRILLLDDAGTPPAEIDPAPGDHFMGGFSRDGKRFFYAVSDGGNIALKMLPLDTKKPVEVTPPPPAAGVQPAAGSTSLSEALAGLFALGPPSPDARTLLASVQRGQGEALVLIDLPAGRATTLTDVPARWRQPRFSPDGKTVYALTDTGRKTMGVQAISLPNKAQRTIYAPPQNLEAFAISEDGHKLAVAAEATGETLFSVLDIASLRAQPLAVLPAGALAQVLPGESPLIWDRTGERLFFAWRVSDDTTDVWQLRQGYGTPLRLTRSPRPGLPRKAIVRPSPVKLGDQPAWLWRPQQPAKPRVAVMIASGQTRPIFDKRIAALNYAGFAVLAVNGPDAQAAALEWLGKAEDLSNRDPILLNFDGLPVDDLSKWGGVVTSPGKHGGLVLEPERPDLDALVTYARRNGGT